MDISNRQKLTLFSAGAVAAFIAIKVWRQRSLSPPFQLQHPLPSPELLHIVSKASRIAQQNGYLVSFESQQKCIASKGSRFMATLALNLSQKPKPKMGKALRDPFLLPFARGAHVTDLHGDYRILLNKFNVVANHILIVTRHFEPQTAPLTVKDFAVAMDVVRAMHGLCYFNRGPLSGA